MDHSCYVLFGTTIPVIFSDALYNAASVYGSDVPNTDGWNDAFGRFLSMYGITAPYSFYHPTTKVYLNETIINAPSSQFTKVNSYIESVHHVIENTTGLIGTGNYSSPYRTANSPTLTNIGDTGSTTLGCGGYSSNGRTTGYLARYEEIKATYTGAGGTMTGNLRLYGVYASFTTNGASASAVDFNNLYSGEMQIYMGLVYPESAFILDDPNNKYIIGDAVPKVVDVYITATNYHIHCVTLSEPSFAGMQEFIDIDPMSGGGYSGSAVGGVPGIQPDGTNAGGDGTFTLQSNDVPESALPPVTSSLVGAGCGTVYCDDGSNVRSLMSYMWTHADDIIANLKKIIANPIDSILGLHIVPVVPSVGTSAQVHLGNVGTGVNMTPVTNPYLRYRLGSIVINKYWGSALDFSPFTQFNIHLPYVGFRQLNTDDLMGSRVELYYDIDVISGACVAHLKVTRTDPLTKETHTVDQYSWAGNCAMQVPVTSTNYQSLYSFIFNSAVSVGMAFATGAAGMIGGTMTMGQYAATIGQSLSTTANNLFNGGSKIRVEKSGNVNGAHGFLDSQYAYIERITPRQSLAYNYRQVLGYPSNTTQVLGTCTGFTQIEDINLENFSCTADEKNELERLLKGGVIF